VLVYQQFKLIEPS